MDLQYYIQYILSWVVHNVIYTDASSAILRILIVIGLVSLFVYRQYILFVLLCIIVLSAEYLAVADDDSEHPFTKFAAALKAPSPPRIVDKDELTRGISIDGREGFSMGMPKIIKGDDSGKDHRRSNKFIEEDSREFSERYFNTKRCSIGSGIGGISMFGSNELIGESREATIRGIYDFAGNVTTNDSNGDPVKRLKYFKECVFEPIKRNDFRDFKQKIYTDVTSKIINIENCLKRFHTGVLFSTSSDVNAGYSTRLTTLMDKRIESGTTPSDPSFNYVSLITGENNTAKLLNIQPLNKGAKGDNFNEQTYSALLKATNESNEYKNQPGLKQRAMDIFGKVYGYRTRIDEILAMMRAQTKDDAALLQTVRISESVVQELRTMLAYLAIIQRTDAVIKFDISNGIYDKLNTTPPPTTLGTLPTVGLDKISGANNIFRIPLDDDTYNTNDEKRYVYGITYYFDTENSKNPYP
ncbi:hypothetical protein EBR96_07105 [bacterium]|nr:hypothetical protein [bacterium]